MKKLEKTKKKEVVNRSAILDARNTEANKAGSVASWSVGAQDHRGLTNEEIEASKTKCASCREDARRTHEHLFGGA